MRQPIQQRAVSAATATGLSGLARISLTLIAIDDVQSLDAPYARALEFAVRRFARERVGVLLTLRSSDRSGTPLGRTTPRVACDSNVCSSDR